MSLRPGASRPTTSIANSRRDIDEILVERRCLGQTELKVKPGQVGSSNATKPENLGELAQDGETPSHEDYANATMSGVLDYAHLRVPLPSDLSTSGIFTKGPNRKYPEAYFLMVSGKLRDLGRWMAG